MKKATKAALLSGLVFPGVGQLYLKRWAPGLVLAGVAGYAFYTIVSMVVRVTSDIVQKVESGAASADPQSISLMVQQQVSATLPATNTATLVLGACWVISIVAALWQGRAEDKREAGTHIDR